MPQITRSTGLGTGYLGFIAGGGYAGATDELDSTVARAGELLREYYRRDVTIRFNSDRRSGGAWLVTHARDSFSGNSEIGICAGLYPPRADADRIWADESLEWRQAKRLLDALPRELCIEAHIGNASLRDKHIVATERDGGYPGELARCYCHKDMRDLATALAFLQSNAILRRKY